MFGVKTVAHHAGLVERMAETVGAGLGDAVDVRRGDLAVTVEGIVAPAGVVGQKHDHIRRCALSQQDVPAAHDEKYQQQAR